MGTSQTKPYILNQKIIFQAASNKVSLASYIFLID